MKLPSPFRKLAEGLPAGQVIGHHESLRQNFVTLRRIFGLTTSQGHQQGGGGYNLNIQAHRANSLSKSAIATSGRLLGL